MTDGWASSPWGAPAAADVEVEQSYVQAGPSRSSSGRTMAARRAPSLIGSPAYGRRSDFGYWKAFKMTRATLGLIIIALGLGLALAAGLGAVVWAVAAAFHHAASQ